MLNLPTMQNPLIVTGKPLEKLITLVGQAIGTVYEPRKIRRKAEADAYRIEKIAEAKAKGLLITSSAELTVAERAHNRMMMQQIDSQINIENIIDKTGAQLAGSANSDEVDHDWANRFFTKAQEVSNEELQEIWAKILATEVSTPGAISLRTLNLLSDLTAQEGQIFQVFCSLSFDHDGIYHPIGGEIYQEYGLNYAGLQKLRSAGLVHASDTLIMKFSYDAEHQGWVIIWDRKAYVMSNGTEKDISLNLLALTTEGEELMNLIKTPKNAAYFLAFQQNLFQNRKITTTEVASKSKP